MNSRKLYSEFEKAANKFNTLKFVDLTDLEFFSKKFIKTSKENQAVFDENNGAVLIVRKDELVRRHIKSFEVYDPTLH